MLNRVQQSDVHITAVWLSALVAVLVDVHREHEFVRSVDMLEHKQPPAVKERVGTDVVRKTVEIHTEYLRANRIEE